MEKEKTGKIFVLDTNVILFDPSAIFKFGNNSVYIPLIVIEEIDRFKRDQNENGRNARYFGRLMDGLRSLGHLSQGVPLESGGKLMIGLDRRGPNDHNALIDLSKNDNLILSTALTLKEEGKNVLLVTKDINLRLKADVLGVPAEDFGTQDVTYEELYTGHRMVEVPLLDFHEFERNRFLPAEKMKATGICPNEYVTLQEKDNPSHRTYGRYHHGKLGLIPLIPMREGAWGIYPKNVEQRFAFDALLNDEVKLVTLVGKAGTGKTLMAIAAGLEMTVAKEKFIRLLVSRPVQPLGRDIGFLPGDVNDKLGPWMQPIFDNMDFLFGSVRGASNGSWEELINQGLLHVEPLTYIRGRSIPGQYLIVDEAQNLSPHEVKTIVTRAGEGTKIVLTGDCEQIDNPYLDSVNNGLAYCVDRLKSNELIAHASLKIGERSQLSEIASKML
ncbi:MAG: phosphate starvation-inducible protein PhoH [Bdellovibrionales bacterium GWA2_49_15]|nr:MAG: phosphate starvation-inducible protein PhoH [Bdellovibrionales bacterium GWA2_49_15]HAZ11834.1 phosphate starvation-inducible protein PhoH [Bdellovibrionales bacterium]